MNSDKKIKNIINSRLAEITVNKDLENKILKGSLHKKTLLRRPVALAFVICICGMLSIPVMAVKVPTFNKLVHLIDTQVASFLQPIALVSEDNGIKMEVVAAMNDDETVIVYLTLQDLTGDRIDRTVDLYNYSINGVNMFTHELVDYDETTKTAMIRMIANGGNKMNGKKVTVRVSSFLSGKQYYDEIDTHITLADVINDIPTTIKLDMQNISGGGGELYSELQDKGIIDILKVDERIISFPNIDFTHISNIGYINGKLHVQTKWKKRVDDHGFVYLMDTRGEVVHPSNVHFGIDELGDTMYGNDYIEYIFDIDPTQASNYSLYGYFVKNDNYTEGNWATTFRIEAVDKATKVVKDVDLGNVKLDEVIIEPIGINVRGHMKSPDQIVIELTMRDGAIVSYDHAVSQESNDKLNVKYFPNIPIKIEDIKELRVNGTVVHFN